MLPCQLCKSVCFKILESYLNYLLVSYIKPLLVQFSMESYQFWILQILASVSLSMVSISYGMVLAFTGTLLPLIKDYVDAENGTWLAATNTFLMVVGTYSSIFLIPWMGNKISLIVTQILALSGWWILSFATEFYQFEVGCILIGFSNGFAYQISLSCRIEILAKELRGLMSNIICSCFMLGILLGHLSTVVLPWRLAMKCCSIIPLLSMALIIFFFPEIPSWYLSRGDVDKAKTVFFGLRGVSKKSEAEFLMIKEKQWQFGTLGIAGTLRNLTSKKFLAPLLIGSILLTAQSGSGYDVIVIYSVDLLKEMSSKINPAQVTILFDSVSWLFCILSCFVVGKISRRKLFFISTIGTTLILVILMTAIVYKMPATVLLVCLCIYTGIANLAMLPLSWLIMAEVFPEGSRDFGICICTGYFCFFTFLLTKAVPFVVSLGGIVAALGFFIAILLICTVLLYFIMPETKEFTLQEIEDEISRGKLYNFLSVFDRKREKNYEKLVCFETS